MEQEYTKYHFVIPLYEVAVTVYVSSDMKFNVDAVNKDFGIKVETSKYLAKALQVSTKADVKFVMMFQNNDHLAKVIAHESLHISWYVCKYLGIDLTYENHEAQAYILEHIVDRVNNFLI